MRNTCISESRDKSVREPIRSRACMMRFLMTYENRDGTFYMGGGEKR